MSNIPEGLYYSKTHEWIKLGEDNIATLGVTDHAQEFMGDVVYVDLPSIGDSIKQGGECGVLESVKSASDLYSPLAGEITNINEKLITSPELINKDPYGDGWILKISAEDPEKINALMSAKEYEKFLTAV